MLLFPKLMAKEHESPGDQEQQAPQRQIKEGHGFSLRSPYYRSPASYVNGAYVAKNNVITSGFHAPHVSPAAGALPRQWLTVAEETAGGMARFTGGQPDDGIGALLH